MIIRRRESWGIIQYDTKMHRFLLEQYIEKDAVPYTNEPVLLNCELTFECNMCCKHCVSKDLREIIKDDLSLSNYLIDWINKSPFMVIVITGGEPLMEEYQSQLLYLLNRIKNKGIIIDTNGTIIPRKEIINIIREKSVLVRVSWDSVRPQDEICLRQRKKDSDSVNNEIFFEKIEIIKRFISEKVNVAIQSVLHKKNKNSIINIPQQLKKYSINKWYVQRFIPSYLVADQKLYDIESTEYNYIINKLSKKSTDFGIELIAKKDKRHNSVFLLGGKGLVYTQGSEPRQKIYLGNIKSDNIKYFDYVSSSDHSERYYDKKSNL